MPTPPAILNKVKLLLKLSASPNPHEADSARKLAEGLIEKHNITPEELETIKDPKPLYGDDERLFITLGIIGWRQQLAVSVANHFDCQIVQEELVPMEGQHPFHYFVYGDPNDVRKVQFAFHAFANKVELLSDHQCLGRGPVYISSYCEGIVDSIKQNIWLYGVQIPEQKETVRDIPAQAITAKSEELTKPKEERPKAADRHVDVASQSNVQDVMAYFRGVQDGKDLFLDDILEIAAENEEAAKLQQATKDET
jgi:hypothetical protein